ncbi:PAB-dependent poly(A)-specific ribonuclease subunit 2 [Trichinella spiralis]|uniref:PAB-dependent poly(A)-specific ribonuclease subunit 2 n=1 Tax=Trichinella spiralis TaxID=6334 RepID=UPI0001EFD098|nr:PAB-dependent poly(A)-specific ribonuclease subunit 2 [Trichinella spiralis]
MNRRCNLRCNGTQFASIQNCLHAVIDHCTFWELLVKFHDEWMPVGGTVKPVHLRAFYERSMHPRQQTMLLGPSHCNFGRGPRNCQRLPQLLLPSCHRPR